MAFENRPLRLPVDLLRAIARNRVVKQARTLAAGRRGTLVQFDQRRRAVEARALLEELGSHDRQGDADQHEQTSYEKTLSRARCSTY